MKNNNIYLLVSTHAVIGQFSGPYLLYRKAIVKLANASYLEKKNKQRKTGEVRCSMTVTISSLVA